MDRGLLIIAKGRRDDQLPEEQWLQTQVPGFSSVVGVLKTGRKRLDVFAERLKQEHLAALEQGQEGVFKPVTIRFKGETEQYYIFRS